MMPEDSLAQEEIDALLKAAKLSDAPKEKADKKDLSEELAGEFLNSINEIFLALLGNEVTVERAESGPLSIDMIKQKLTKPVAIALIDSEKGLDTKAALLFNEKQMTIITDLILMGKGEEKEKFTDNDLDALKEAINQTMSNLGQNLTGKYGETISFKQADVKVLSPADAVSLLKETLKEDSFHSTLFSLNVADKLDTMFRLLLPLSIEEDLARLDKKFEERKALSPAAADGSAGTGTDIANLDMILDLKVEITVKLGETVKPLRDIINLIEGNIVALDKAADAPVEVMVNNKVIAKGELIVIPPYHFAIKVTEVKDRMDRIKTVPFH